MPGPSSPNIRFGRAYVRVNGTLLETMPNAKLSNIQGIERTPVEGSAVYGFMEKVVTPTIESEFAYGPAVSMAALNALVDTTVTFECDTGATFILRNAWTAKLGDLTSGKGTFSATFQGLQCEEQLSG
jgi:hypothetical protein